MKKLSLAVICAVVLVFVVGVFASALAAPGIVVIPDQYDFGEVEIGFSSSTQVEISNAWWGDLTIESITLLQSGQDFSMISPPPPDTVVQPGSSVFMEVAYSPTSLGADTATLVVEWTNGEQGTSHVELSGTGVEATGEEVTFESILAFFDASVEAGTLQGTGPGSSGEAHINVLKHMLVLAAKLFDDGLTDVACQQLEFVYNRCDGVSPPPDFVEGPALQGDDGLRQMILDLMTELGCQ